MSAAQSRYQFISHAKLPTKFGDFTIHGFVDNDTGQDHVALSYGTWQDNAVVPIRIHSECLTGDALFSTRCDCGFQLEKALENIADAGFGVLLYLRQEGRGIGLINKIKAYSLQDEGLDTVEANQHLGFDADLRDYNVCKVILAHLNIKKVEIMTNNPKKTDALEKMGIDVVARKAIDHGVTDSNKQYLMTKTSKLGHHFNVNKLK